MRPLRPSPSAPSPPQGALTLSRLPLAGKRGGGGGGREVRWGGCGPGKTGQGPGQGRGQGAPPFPLPGWPCPPPPRSPAKAPGERVARPRRDRPPEVCSPRTVPPLTCGSAVAGGVGTSFGSRAQNPEPTQRAQNLISSRFITRIGCAQLPTLIYWLRGGETSSSRPSPQRSFHVPLTQPLPGRRQSGSDTLHGENGVNISLFLFTSWFNSLIFFFKTSSFSGSLFFFGTFKVYVWFQKISQPCSHGHAYHDVLSISTLRKGKNEMLTLLSLKHGAILNYRNNMTGIITVWNIYIYFFFPFLLYITYQEEL